ncbi:unnamed protein product [Penicillium nalgiovense]|nr:unnamed protein product [Penicillium nalgiovense]
MFQYGRKRDKWERLRWYKPTVDDADQRKRETQISISLLIPSNMAQYIYKIKSIFQRTSNKKPDNFRHIPPEIVDILFIFLQFAEQVCLALTCTYLFACYKSFLHVRKTGVPELLYRETVVELCLVHQLQHGCWGQFCWCYKLNPSCGRAFLWMCGYRANRCSVRDIVG